MLRLQIVLSLLILFLSVTAFQGTFARGSTPGESQCSGVEVNLIRDNPAATHLQVTVKDIKHEQISLNSQQFDRFTIGDEMNLTLNGFPDLPCISRMVIIPPQSDVQLKINHISQNIQTSVNPVMTAVTQLDNSFSLTADPDYLNHSGFWPSEPVHVGKPAIMRGCRMVNVMIFPLQYNRTTGEMRINEELDFELTYDGTGENVGVDPTRNLRSPTFDRIIRSLVVNPPPSRDDPVQHGSIAYVTGNWDDVVEDLEPLLEWRRRMGWTVELILIDNPMEAVEIQEGIQEAYDEWEIPPEYVVICGEAPGSANNFLMNYVHEEHGANWTYETDHHYGELEGDDILPEAAVGRLSFETIDQLETIVDKIIEYESNPFIGEDDEVGWQKRGAVVAGYRDSGLSSIDACNWCRNLMLKNDFDEVNTLYFTPNNPEPYAMDFYLTNMNDGISIFLYRGWIRINELYPHYIIEQANNERMLPFVVLSTCNSGDYGQGLMDAIAPTEALLRDDDGGAIGAVGASGATHTAYNNLLMASCMKALFADEIYTQGWVLMRGKLDLYRNYYDRGDIEHPENHEQESWLTSTYVYNLMGDPAVDLYTDIPRDLVVEHNGIINVGTTIYEVQVTFEDDEEPAGDVQVCLYKPEDFQVVELTDDEGLVRFDLEPDWVDEGAVMLTVTGHNLMPYLADVEIVEANLFLGADVYELEDDGDGIANPTEEITLIVDVRNFGDGVPEGEIRAVLTTDHPYLEVLGGEAEFNEAPNPGDAVQAEFEISIGGGFPHGETAIFDMMVTNDDDEWFSSVGIPVIGPAFEIDELIWDDEPLEPGQGANLIINIRNVGGIDSSPLDATLISRNRLISVPFAETEYAEVFAGESQQPESMFGLAAGDMFVAGSDADFALVLQGDNGFIDTVYFAIVVGAADPSVPFGPDNYGYWCIDNADVDWDIAPEFEWIEIDPDEGGDGVDTELSDRSEENDESVAIDLPFEFQYYGEEFDVITVCTNGWLAMGNQANLFTGRNRRIPSGMVASGMICPFWNDLLTTHDGGIYTYFDEDEQKFIVEWSKVRRLSPNGGQEPLLTFQVVLFNPDFYPTLTGDGDIVFQYLEIEDTRQCYSWDTPFATIGIGSPDLTEGLEYSYWNDPNPAAAPIEDGLAIKFCTMLSFFVAGCIDGRVTDAENGDPIEDVLVLTNWGSWGMTDENGEYLLENVIADTLYSVSVSAYKEFWIPQTIEVIPVLPDDTTEVNFELLHPEFELSPDYLHVRIRPDSTQTQTVRLTNNGNGDLYFSSRFELIDEFNAQSDQPGESGETNTPNRDDPDDAWDLILSLDVTEASEDYRIQGIVYAEDRWIISGDNNREETNYFYSYNESGLIRFRQPIDGRFGVRDMEYNDGFIYASNREDNTLLEINPSDGALNRSIDTPERVSSINCLTINPSNGHFFVAGITNDVFEMELDNDSLHVVRSFRPQDPRDRDNIRKYGLAWFGDDRDGFPLYIMGHKDIEEDPNLPDISIFKADPETEEVRFVTGLPDIDPLCQGRCGITITPDWNNLVMVFAAILDNPEGDIAVAYELDLNTTWINYSPRVDTLVGGSSVDLEFSFDASGFDLGLYQIGLDFTHNASPGRTMLPIVFDVDYHSVEDEVSVPLDYSLSQNHPNPFNPVTDIAYSLREAGSVKLVVYDMLGRDVDVLVDGYRAAGRYNISFDARNLAAGLYFYRLETGEFRSVKKMVLVK